MAIQHHPDISTLMSCAAGSQPEALAAVVASHVAMCPACNSELRKMQQIGVALFEKLPAADVIAKAPVIGARAAEAESDIPEAHHSAVGDVPAHLAPLLGANLDSVAWKLLAPGIWHYPIPLSKGAKGDLRLVKVAPGKELPEHGHAGEELTLLLRGSYRDEVGTFKTGDIADLDNDIEHRPVADPETGCICLIASEKKARFKGLIARLVQPFTGI